MENHFQRNSFDSIKNRPKPLISSTVLLFTDLVSITIVILTYLLLPNFTPLRFFPLILLILLPLAYYLFNLYSMGISPPEEISRIFYSTFIVFLAIFLGISVESQKVFRFSFLYLFTFILTTLLVPLNRSFIKNLLSKKPWWGTGVIILGGAKTGELVIKKLLETPILGLKPIAIFDDDPEKWGKKIYGVPVVGKLKDSAKLAKMGIRHVILAITTLTKENIDNLLEVTLKDFPHIIIIPNLFGFPSLWVTTLDFGGFPGLEIKQQLLLRPNKLAKRILDLSLLVIFSPLILIITAIIAILVKLTSKGPVFFTQLRPTKNGKPFKIYKFRTMYEDAEKRFDELPNELKKEFFMYGKIRDDPRVTKFGSILRKFSLDELPQLFNVFKGEMSLVGPRPYLFEQIPLMGNKKEIILSVTPGITGLWQISGRSDLFFEERLELDLYYIKNWSIWLDIYILFRTIGVVLRGKGAY